MWVCCCVLVKDGVASACQCIGGMSVAIWWWLGGVLVMCLLMQTPPCINLYCIGAHMRAGTIHKSSNPAHLWLMTSSAFSCPYRRSLHKEKAACVPCDKVNSCRSHRKQKMKDHQHDFAFPGKFFFFPARFLFD